MDTTRLSSKGQVIIPKSFRDHHGWDKGQELELIDTDEGVLLRARPPFPPTTLDAVAGSLAYAGAARTLDDLAAAIGEGIRSEWP